MTFTVSDSHSVAIHHTGFDQVRPVFIIAYESQVIFNTQWISFTYCES